MKSIFTAICIMLASCSRPVANLKTIGGHPTNAPEYGFAVALVDAKTHEQFCSGSLIAPNTVLTAGHCVSYLNPYLDLTNRLPSAIMVHFGAGSPNKIHENLVKVAKISVAPQHVPHNNQRHDGDAAYLTLAETAPAWAKPVKVMLDEDELVTYLHKGLPTQLIGFGCSDTSVSCSKGNKTMVDMAINEVGPLVVDAGTPTKSAMHGDSGGSLVVSTSDGPQLIGIVSGQGRVQGAYSLISPFACWIDETAALNLPHAKDHCAVAGAVESRDFIDICKNPSSAYQKRTVDVLLRKVHSAKCEEAASRLAELADLNLDGELIHDLSPLIGMNHLKTLSVHENALTNVLPIAQLPMLESVQIDVAQLSVERLFELNRLQPKLKFISDDIHDLMMNAVDKNDIQMVRVLADSVIDWERPSKDGETYFLLAVRKNYRDIAELLLSRGANVNARNLDTRSTALVYAAIDDSLEWTLWLLSHGANACLKNKFDETVAAVAKRVDSMKVLKILSAIPCS